MKGRVASACALFVASAVAAAQNWPAKPVRMVVPFPPGGSVVNLPLPM